MFLGLSCTSTIRRIPIFTVLKKVRTPTVKFICLRILSLNVVKCIILWRKQLIFNFMPTQSFLKFRYS